MDYLHFDYVFVLATSRLDLSLRIPTSPAHHLEGSVIKGGYCHIRRLRRIATARCRGGRRADPRTAPVSHHRLWRLPLENHRGRPRYTRTSFTTRLSLVPMFRTCPDSPHVSYLFHRTGPWPRLSYIRTSYVDTCTLVRISSFSGPKSRPSKSQSVSSVSEPPARPSELVTRYPLFVKSLGRSTSRRATSAVRLLAPGGRNPDIGCVEKTRY